MASDGEPPYDPARTGSWLVCTACGTQFATSDRQELRTCFICDDPRQFTPPGGQRFTTLDDLRAGGYRNVWTPFPADAAATFTSIATEPKFAIGQRAVLIQTPRGNVLWDCLTLLDDATIARVTAAGGLAAIVISHPHYYTAHLEWARAFDCPVYLAAEDAPWLAQASPARQVFVAAEELDVSGVRVLKLGGHFPGSLVALCDGRLLVADTLVTTPSGLGSWEVDAAGEAGRGRPRGMNSYAFMWSIPNMIPLAPGELERMWGVLGGCGFRSTHGAFVGSDIAGSEAEMKQRVLESMQIQIRAAGHDGHALLKETID